MVLASLTTVKHRALASRVTWEQMALDPLMDFIAWDSFQQSSIPSSQMALCLQASMDALVANSSLRALLAFSHSSTASAGGVTLPDLVVTTMGEMVVGIPPRFFHHLGACLRKVSTSWRSSFGLWGGGVRMTTGFGLLRVEFLDPWPDVSGIVWDRRFLTSKVMLPSPSDLGGFNLEAPLELGPEVNNFLQGPTKGSEEEDRKTPSPEPPVEELESWVTWKAWMYKTPGWWQELAMVPRVDDHEKLAWDVGLFPTPPKG